MALFVQKKLGYHFKQAIVHKFVEKYDKLNRIFINMAKLCYEINLFAPNCILHLVNLLYGRS